MKSLGLDLLALWCIFESCPGICLRILVGFFFVVDLYEPTLMEVKYLVLEVKYLVLEVCYPDIILVRVFSKFPKDFFFTQEACQLFEVKVYVVTPDSAV
jgi:hypothetical protein